MKTLLIQTETGAGTLQTTKVDNSTKYKDFNYSIKSDAKESQRIDIKNYTDENGAVFEINGITIFGEHLKMLKDFLNS